MDISFLYKYSLIICILLILLIGLNYYVQRQKCTKKKLDQDNELPEWKLENEITKFSILQDKTFKKIQLSND
jgi:hypothetical protein